MNIQHVLKVLGAHFLSLTERGFTYGPQGRMLLRNLEEHWFLHCVTMSRHNIFLSDGFADTLNHITTNAMDDMPFGFAMIGNLKNAWNEDIVPAGYKIGSHRIARLSVINTSSESKDLFHKMQKERKVWWRKLAQNPSRFKITEAKRLRNSDLVEIEAQFPFGNVIIETLTYHTDPRKLFSLADNSKNDLMDAQVVEHIVSLDWGCLALLCDAYNVNKVGKSSIHSRLAPYKVAFYITKEENETNTGKDDLNRFVLYLNNMLRTKGLSTILTSSEGVVNMCLVSFIILVDMTSLESGIIHVKNQSTTLKEAVHITDLVNYISMRC